jgi:hypothetical protein
MLTTLGTLRTTERGRRHRTCQAPVYKEPCFFDGTTEQRHSPLTENEVSDHLNEDRKDDGKNSRYEKSSATTETRFKTAKTAAESTL